MRQHRQRGNDAQPHVGHKGRGDQNAVAKGMHAVAGQHRPATRFGSLAVVVAVLVVAGRDLTIMVFMAVVIQLGLVEQEKKHQAHEQRGKQLLRTSLAFKSFWQQVHEGSGQQRTGSQTQHVRGVARQQAKAEQRCQPHAANASDQRAR